MIVGAALESKNLEFKEMPLMFVCSSKTDTNRLIESSKSSSRGRDFLLPLDYSERAIERALPAYISALIKRNEGMARANSPRMEMLLFVCGTMNIGNALKACGIRNPSKFLLFATKSKLAERFFKANGIAKPRKVELELDPRVSCKVAITELLSE